MKSKRQKQEEALIRLDARITEVRHWRTGDNARDAYIIGHINRLLIDRSNLLKKLNRSA